MADIITSGDPTSLNVEDFDPAITPYLGGRVLDEWQSYLTALFVADSTPYNATGSSAPGDDWTYVAEGTGLGTADYVVTKLTYTKPNTVLSIEYTGNIVGSPVGTGNNFGSYTSIKYVVPTNNKLGDVINITAEYTGNILRGRNGIVIGGTYNHIKVEGNGVLFEMFGDLSIDVNGEISGGTITAYKFTDSSNNTIIATDANISYADFDRNTFNELTDDPVTDNLYAGLTAQGENFGNNPNSVGVNTMVGGLGNDTYFVDNINDVIVESSTLAQGGGSDTVSTDLTYALTAANLDNITLTGTANVDATGNELDNVLTGNAGNNTLTGGAGNDTLSGGEGNDTAVFNVNSSTATVSVRKNGGVSITTSEGTDTLSSIENLQFSNETTTIAALQSAAATPTFVNGGTSFTPSVYSGSVEYLQYEFLGDNVAGDNVSGSNANDFINVRGGNDAVNAGAGDDVIDGGTDSNFLTGGDGDDTFYLDARTTDQKWSTITDFTKEANFEGDQANIFGWQAGVSTLVIKSDNEGADGFKGATYHYDIDGNGTLDTSITFTGLTLAQVGDPLVQSVTQGDGSQLGFLLFG